MTEAAAALRDFERALEDLLGVLENQSAPAAALERATDRAAAAFEAVHEREDDLAHLAPDALRRSRERIASLHALVRQAAESAAAATGRRVGQARDARRALAHLRGETAPHGGACDLEG
jgi:hypothetical protein